MHMQVTIILILNMHLHMQGDLAFCICTDARGFSLTQIMHLRAGVSEFRGSFALVSTAIIGHFCPTLVDMAQSPRRARWLSAIGLDSGGSFPVPLCRVNSFWGIKPHLD